MEGLQYKGIVITWEKHRVNPSSGIRFTDTDYEADKIIRMDRKVVLQCKDINEVEPLIWLFGTDIIQQRYRFDITRSTNGEVAIARYKLK